MKKILLTLSVFFTLAYSVYAASPTLTQANSAPAVGDVWKMYTCDTMAVQGASGASQTWTINVVINTSTPSTTNIVATSSTPYASSFPNSNVAGYYAAQSTYQYFNSSSSGLIQYGTGSASATQIYDSPGISFFTYPFTYNTVASTPSITGSVSATYPITGNCTCTGDAWGTLILNGKTWANVLRHKQDLTVDYDYGFAHSISNIISYSWYDGVHKTPILQITYSDVSGFSTSHSKSIYVGDFVTGIEDLSAQLNFDVYPNPSNGEVKVSLSQGLHGDVTFHVYNSAGALVKEIIREQYASAVETLDLSALAKGMYMVEVVAGEARATRRIVVE